VNSVPRTGKNPNPRAQGPRLGTVGALAIFAWYLGSVFILPLGPMVLLSVLGLGIGWIWFRDSLRRLFRWRILLFLVFLFLPPALWIGTPDQTLLGVPFSSEGLQFGLLMAVRAVAMLTVILWFTQSVEITELAGILERAGLHGIGFSMGVAVNFLPTLMRSAQNAWHTLKMRGGLRRNRWKSLELFSVTVIANALRRSEEIALSAEARGFTPGQSVSLPLRRGSWDAWIIALAITSWLLIVIV
jgi:energy-coupling factor transporter transmembrane protein EcfT